MTIYSRFGTEVRLIRPVRTLADVRKIENRKTDAHDKDRLKYGMYVAGRYVDDEEGKEQMFDLGMLRADDGIREINEAARAVGCDPK